MSLRLPQITHLAKTEAGFEPLAESPGLCPGFPIMDHLPGGMAGSGPDPSPAPADLLLPCLRSQTDTIPPWTVGTSPDQDHPTVSCTAFLCSPVPSPGKTCGQDGLLCVMTTETPGWGESGSPGTQEPGSAASVCLSGSPRPMCLSVLTSEMGARVAPALKALSSQS